MENEVNSLKISELNTSEWAKYLCLSLKWLQRNFSKEYVPLLINFFLMYWLQNCFKLGLSIPTSVTVTAVTKNWAHVNPANVSFEPQRTQFAQYFKSSWKFSFPSSLWHLFQVTLPLPGQDRLLSLRKNLQVNTALLPTKVWLSN